MYYVQMCLFNECQLMGFFFSIAELVKQFFSIRCDDSCGPCLSPFSNADRVPSVGVHLKVSDLVRRFQLSLSEFLTCHYYECPSANCKHLSRHISSRSWNHHQVNIY